MANGDIVKFGRWKLTRKDGTYVYDTYHNTFVTLDYQSYNKIELTYENNASYDQLEWIEYGINGQKIYISKNYLLENLFAEHSVSPVAVQTSMPALLSSLQQFSLICRAATRWRLPL